MVRFPATALVRYGLLIAVAVFAPTLFYVGGPVSSAEKETNPAAPLVTRNHAKLGLAGAERILDGAKTKAAAMKLKVNISVVDDGGHPLAFARMDGARPASAYTAMTKATAAATLRQPTGPIPGDPAPDALLNLSLQNAASASGGKITTLLGGVPITIDGQIVGAVGVGGATGEQDAEIARAGIAALTSAVGAQ